MKAILKKKRTIMIKYPNKDIIDYCCRLIKKITKYKMNIVIYTDNELILNITITVYITKILK